MVGIGYRKDIGDTFLDGTLQPDFIEVAPENWINVGGYWKRQFKKVLENYPLYTHGLSLSIGAPDEVDMNFLKQIKQFIKDFDVQLYSEHLSYSQCENAHVYDLLPIPFTEDAVKHIVQKIKQVQDFLERPLVLEQASYYTAVAPEMTELEFINAIITESGCNMLLDVNNVYVNSFNHGYNAEEFISNLPLEQVAYIHMAGHTKVADDLIIDTHGMPIIDPVYKLFDFAMHKLKRDVPVLLERDFNFPEMEELQEEITQLRTIKANALKTKNSHAIA